MKSHKLSYERGFRVAPGNARSQAAVMVLEPGASEGGPDNRHQGADQWLLVVSGTGVAFVEGRSVGLEAGSAVLIEAGERHEIRNTGHGPLRTISVYVPPAYDDEGEELPAGKA